MSRVKWTGVLKSPGTFEQVGCTLLQNTEWKDASESVFSGSVCVFFHLSFMRMNRHCVASQHFIAWLYIQLLWLRIKLKAWLYCFGF